VLRKNILIVLLIANWLFAEVNDFDDGLKAFKSGDYKEAIAAYERVLIYNENNHRARLELARSYMALFMYDSAKVEFEIVLASNPPKEVRKNIEKFLQLIEKKSKQHKWNLLLSLGIGDDSNINSSPNELELINYLSTSFPSLNPNNFNTTGELDGRYISEYLGLSHTYKKRPDAMYSWQNSIQIANQNFQGQHNDSDKSDYDFTYMKYNTALGIDINRYKALFPIYSSKLIYGGKSTFNTYGIEPTLSTINNNFLFNIKSNYYQKRYLSNSDKGKNSNYLDGSFEIYYALKNHFTNIKITLAKESKKNNNSIDTFIEKSLKRLNLGYSYKFNSYTFGANYTYTDTKYDDLIDKSNKKRNDNLKSFSLQISKSLSKNIDLGVNYQQNKNNSNYTPSSYSKNIIALNITYKIGGLR